MTFAHAHRLDEGTEVVGKIFDGHGVWSYVVGEEFGAEYGVEMLLSGEGRFYDNYVSYLVADSMYSDAVVPIVDDSSRSRAEKIDSYIDEMAGLGVYVSYERLE